MSLSTRIRFYIGEYYDALTQYDFQQPPKPWSEFFQKFSFPKPTSLYRRLAINAEYFSANYLRLFLITIILAIWSDRRVWSFSTLGYPQWKMVFFFPIFICLFECCLRIYILSCFFATCHFSSQVE
ncbi:hypothetical protein Gasu2_18650 [Galdieria sulphuraria]|nr:hypothetical protein Gasu2_18650 [Galdieria sulphuraria]